VEHEANAEHFANLLESYWWSLVTMTTVGYGDKYPITYWGRTVASLTMIFGMTTFSIFSARIISFIIERSLKEGSGLANIDTINNHLVICGWKKNMNYVLENIIKFDPELNREKIVLIANIDPENFNSLQHNNRLFEDVKFVKGDPFSGNVLRRGSVQTAQKVLILANEIEGLTENEVDNLTVMTVLAVKNLKKKITVCAEILDAKFEGFLIQAGCDEIIYSRKYSTKLLGNVIAQPGLTSIVNCLLDNEQNSTSRITIEKIPGEYINKTYKDLNQYVKQQNQHLIGILENTGQPIEMKTEAIRQAQKTPDISQLVDNLRSTKDLRINVPQFNLDQEYIIPKYAKAIVIKHINQTS